MDQEIYISETLNRWLFVAQVCGIRDGEWLTERQDEWISQSGGVLNVLEQRSANQLREFHQKQDSGFVEILFLEGVEAAWDRICVEYGREYCEALRDTLMVFSERFQRYWSVAFPRLERIRSYLSGRSEILQRGLHIVERLCALPEGSLSFQCIPWFLAIAGSNPRDIIGWFSHRGQHNAFVLEYEGDPTAVSGLLEGIAMHELIHLGLRLQGSLVGYIQSESRSMDVTLSAYGMSVERVFEELLVSSFTPEGALSEIVFGKVHGLGNVPATSAERSLVSLRRWVAAEMHQRALEYLNGGRAIDQAYIREVLAMVQKAPR